ncbi:MAG: hypothetical protein NVSMB24_37220 [Mucilaginibacter sp.]
MKQHLFKALLVALFLTSVSWAVVGIHPITTNASALSLEQTILLPGVHGKFDHMAIDITRQRLFLAAKGNNSVEVVDLKNGKPLFSIKQVSAPQGLLFLSKQNMILVCGGGDGTLKGFDAANFKLKFTVSLGNEADNIRYSPINHKIYVAYGDGAIAVIDDQHYRKLYDIPCYAHPEAFSLNTTSKRMWVNVPDKNIISVVDLYSKKVIVSWKTADHQDNFPMSLVENSNKLIVASRSNPVISILNSQTGKLLQSFPCDSDPDAMFYDKKTDRIFISCGGGALYLLNGISKESINQPVILPTRKGARTCLWVAEMNELFVALPELKDKPAEIRIYQ